MNLAVLHVHGYMKQKPYKEWLRNISIFRYNVDNVMNDEIKLPKENPDD